jgi:hypothetical protein
MADSSAIPVRRIYDARQAKAKSKTDGATPSILPSISPTGPRKLVRPPLPLGTGRYPARVSAISSAFTNHTRVVPAAVRGESSHAVRTLIYKAGIKYLYKAADTNQINGRP